MNKILLGTSVIAVAIVCFPASVRAQSKKKKVPGAASARKAVKKLSLKWLKERSLSRMVQVDSRGRSRSAGRRLVYRSPGKGRAFWSFLPKSYAKKFKKNTWCKEFSFAWENRKDGAVILEDARVDSITVSRDAVLVQYSGHYVTLSNKFFSDVLADRRYTVDKKRSHNWYVWVRQGKRYFMSWNRLESERTGPVREDSMAMSGEALLTHPWFKNTLSMNEVAVAHFEAQHVGKHGRDTKLQQEQARKEAEAEVKALVERREIADVGDVDEVSKPKPREAPEGTNLVVKISCGWFIVLIYVSDQEVAKRGDFYRGLKKGDPVVWRTRFQRKKASFDATLRTDGKPTIERFWSGAR